MASLQRSVRSDFAQAGLLTETVHRLLTEKECSIFNRGLADYHKRRNVKSLVECLSLVLTSGPKRRLLIPIRDTYVKPSDLSKFNQLAQAQGITTSHRKKLKTDEISNNGGRGDGLRKIEVRRDTGGEWGFSIRGGSEHGLGIFVSWIEPRSNAEKSGLQVGDQILKANNMSFNMITQYDAMMVIQGAKRLQIQALAHSVVPGSRMAHKVYHWVDPGGRPCSPPPDPFDSQDRARGRNHKWMIEADERKVTVMINKRKDLGISIRGGIEHGLGIYISAVEEYSVAESYGLKVGDQILEVNGVSFLGIVHSDAAHALSAQPCMVMKVKEVGKLPHSRMTTYNQTKRPAAHDDISISSHPPQIFRTGLGSQIMLGQQQDSLLRGHGLLKDVAQSVLSEQELAMFMHHVSQYQQYNLPVNKLLPPILNLLDTPEKLRLLTELRGLMNPQDIEQFNELTVHKEIMANKYAHCDTTPRNAWPPTGDGGCDIVPQKLSPERPAKVKHFHAPLPPTSTPAAIYSEVQKTWNREDTWDGQWDNSELSSIHPTEKVDTSLIEARIRTETESRLQNVFDEEKKTIVEDHRRLLEEERAQNELTLRRQREDMKKQMKQKEQFLKAQIERSIQLDSAREVNSQLAEKELSLQEEKERLFQGEDQLQQRQKQLRQELEEQIWKEADDRLRGEYEQKLQQERGSLQRQTKVSEKTVTRDMEGRIRRNLESKIKREYEEKLAGELGKLKKQEEKEMAKREEESEWKKQEEVARLEAEVARLEAEEQSRIELEEKIRRETELKLRAEYEVHLNNETKERAKLTEELRARKSAEEKLQKERIKLQREGERQQKKFEEERKKERKEREKALADIANEKQELERMIKQQQHSQQGEETSDEEDGEEARSETYDLTPDQSQEQKMLEKQHHFRLNVDERKQEQTQKAKRKELEQKREENLRKREEMRKQKELERKLLSDKPQQPSPCLMRDPYLAMEKAKKRQEAECMAAVAISSQVREKFGEGESSQKIKKAMSIEEERLKAEQKLEQRLKRSQEKEKKTEPKHLEEEVPVEINATKSFGGFTELQGNIVHVTVTKVVKKLGIAIDGGANTKQKAVIIREMSPEGCARLTGMGMAVNQQLLQINGKSLFGLKHREVVVEIKKAFEGPMNKVLEFVVLDPTSNQYYCP